MDEHEVGIEEIKVRFGLAGEADNDRLPLIWNGEDWSVDEQNIKGLSEAQVVEARKHFGWNQLTPPKKKPECIALLEHLFCDFFALLLWFGSVLCFIAYAIKLDQDNVSFNLTRTRM